MIKINGLKAGQEYAYQYYIDNGIIVGDPYSEKVLNPDDQYISDAVYPNLKPYPTGKTTGYVSVLQTNQTEYVWQTTGYTRPASEDLVIYIEQRERQLLLTNSFVHFLVLNLPLNFQKKIYLITKHKLKIIF